jgi:hypothetical protein
MSGSIFSNPREDEDDESGSSHPPPPPPPRDASSDRAGGQRAPTPPAIRSASRPSAEDESYLSQERLWSTIATKLYRGDLVKQIQKLLCLLTLEEIHRNHPDPKKSAELQSLATVIYKRLSIQLCKGSGYFAQLSVKTFLNDWLQPRIAAENERAVSVIALLSTKFPEKDKPINEKGGDTILAQAKDARRILRNDYCVKFEKYLVNGKPRTGKTWADVLGAVMHDCWLDKLKIPRGHDGEYDNSLYKEPDPKWMPPYWVAFVLCGPYGVHELGMDPLGLLSAGDAELADENAIPRSVSRDEKRQRQSSSDSVDAKFVESITSLVSSMNSDMQYSRLEGDIRTSISLLPHTDGVEKAKLLQEISEMRAQLVLLRNGTSDTKLNNERSSSSVSTTRSDAGQESTSNGRESAGANSTMSDTSEAKEKKPLTKSGRPRKPRATKAEMERRKAEAMDEGDRCE